MKDAKFQFTHPGGVRHDELCSVIGRSVFQFTHPGGVRRSCFAPVPHLGKFQFTHPGGVRLTTSAIQFGFSVSIHAPGRGATSSSSSFCLTAKSFNSRTREGCDRMDAELNKQILVSIHAPGRGATLWLRLHSCCLLCFNSRTREGCDRTQASTLTASTMFQFTHPGGVRLLRRFIVFIIFSCFNSRTREGCDSMVQSCVLWGG